MTQKIKLNKNRRILSSGMWRRVDLVSPDVSEKLIASLKMVAIRSSETTFHTKSTRRHIPEDGILHTHRRENLKSYINKNRRNYDNYHSRSIVYLKNLISIEK
jgi:hypothetical protein